MDTKGYQWDGIYGLVIIAITMLLQDGYDGKEAIMGSRAPSRIQSLWQGIVVVCRSIMNLT